MVTLGELPPRADVDDPEFDGYLFTSQAASPAKDLTGKKEMTTPFTTNMLQ